MTSWVTNAAEAATAAGTLVLAVATFASVRSSQRGARATEAALLAGIRPVLVNSNVGDPEQKIGFIDQRWLHVAGGGAAAEFDDGGIFLAVSLRNVGNGLAVLDRWSIVPGRNREEISKNDIDGFRRLTRDIYVPAGQSGFWQGAIREADDPMFEAIKEAIAAHEPMTVDILYGDHDGGQRTVSRIGILPIGEKGWMANVARHWYLDRPDPR